MTVPVLEVATVPAYVAANPGLAALVDVETITVREVGDGNLNLVFIVTDAAGGSLALKQSLPYVRMVGESWPLSQDRILAEGRGFDAAVRLSPESVPRYYGLDIDNRTIAMQDLSAWTVWRTALNEGRISRGAAAAIGRYVARVGFGTSAFGLDSVELKTAIGAAANPELCKITEDLVFTQPYTDHPDNSWDPELDADVRSLRAGGLVDEIAALKHSFMSHAESLIHGDLHTGSVFVPATESPGAGTAVASAAGPDAGWADAGAAGPDAAKVFDIEFAFYGPLAFDLGALFGNVLHAQTRAAVLNRPAEFRDWLDSLVAEAWDAFAAEIRALWPTRVDDSFTDAFLEGWLRRTWVEAVGFGGAKAIRRIVGLAKTSDIQSLEPAERVLASRAILRTARGWVENRGRLDSPVALLAAVRDGLA